MKPGEYIVVFKDQWEGRIDNEVAQEALNFVNNKISEFGIEEKHVKSKYEHALRGFAATLTEAQLKSIIRNPQVDFVEQDRHYAFGPYSDLKTSSLKSASKTNTSMSQTTPWGVARVGGSLDGTGKKAWIIDTGIDLDHSDLNVDVSNSASFVANESANDIVGHGAHVAGILAAKDNSQGVVGVAADASVVAVKVLHQDPDDNTYSDVVDGVNYVAGKASSGDIINMSLGAYDPNEQNQSIDVAVTNAANSGLRFTIAAGNSSSDADDFTPARVNHSNVWTISGYDDNDDWYTSSNYGNPPIEYSGPGVSVPSLDIGGGITNKTGTSMAAPHVAGIILATGQAPYTNKYVNNDPDNDDDPIASSEPFVEAPNVTGSVQNDSPKLDWQTCDGAHEYEVWRKVESSGSWTLWATVSSTSYTDMITSDPDLQVLSSPPTGPNDWVAYKVRSVHVDDFYSFHSSIIYFETGENAIIPQ